MIFRCPRDPGPNDSLILGCGHVFKSDPDEEGFVDCPNCGVFFRADEPGVEVK